MESQENNSLNGDNNISSVPNNKSSSGRSKHPLPAKKISTVKQFEMLRAFAIAGGNEKKPVSISTVADVQHIHVGSVSICNPFYVDCGFITKQGHTFVSSQEIVAFNQQAEWTNKNAGHKLAPLVEKTWFASAILPKLKLNSLPEGKAIQVLAEESGANPSERRQLVMLLDYLEYSGLIKRENGLILSNNPDQHAQAQESSLDESAGKAKTPQTDDLSSQPKEHFDENKYESFTIPIPGALPARLEIPKGLSSEKWVMLDSLLQIYLTSLKEESGVKKQ